MAKEGSTVSGLMDSLATMTCIALQYGVPLRDLVNKFAHVRFEPAGFTGNQEIPIAKSIVDYVFRWMGSRFLSKDERDALGIISSEAVVAEAAPIGQILTPALRSGSSAGLRRMRPPSGFRMRRTPRPAIATYGRRRREPAPAADPGLVSW